MKKLDKIFNIASKILISGFVVYMLYLIGVHKVMMGQYMFYKDYYENKAK